MMWKIAVGVVVAFVLIFIASFQIRSTAHIEHTLKAPVDEVWKIWNEPEMIKQWWGPKKYTAPTVKNDLRVGGTYLLAMLSPSNDLNYNAGIYKEIVPNQKIVSDMYFSDENGKQLTGDAIKVPGNWPDAMLVTVNFEARGAETHVSVTEEGIPLVMKFLSQVGWGQQFQKIDEIIASKK